MATHEQRARFLDENVDGDHHSLVWSNFPACMASRILEIPRKDHRRIALESIPESLNGIDMRQRVEALTRLLWKRNRRGPR